MWDDALSANKQWWERFCAPFRNGLQGSMMLVTTRSSQVAHGVGTVEHFTLDGLKDDVFWDFFKLCAFGSLSSNNDPELEQIGRSILPKLKGSPLAAQTLGRLLSTSFQTSYWNSILNSELWGLPQEISDILPALQLSYIYLPFHLKRCFSFCAVYPKDYKFEKSILSEIWVAEGFVKREGDIPIVDTGCQYFEDLVSRSFFQKVRGTYVIHDLMHDMAQLVSKHECFTIEDLSDFQKVPRNVRHLMILDSRNFDCSNLLSLCEHTKLRCNTNVRLMKNMNQFFGDFEIDYLQGLSEDLAAEIDLKNKKDLGRLTLKWYDSQEHSKIVFQLLQPPTNLKYLKVFGYGDYMPALQRISITDCEKVAPLPAERKPVSANLKKLELHNSGIIVSNIECCSLTSLLPTLDGLLKKEHLPAIEIINIYSCTGLLSLPGERFGSFTCLSDLRISHCPNINWQSGLVLPSYLKRLSLNNCGNFSAWFPNCLGSLTCLVELTMIKCHGIESFPNQMWRSNLASLKELHIADCPDLVSIGAVKPISKIKTVYIYGCQKLTAVKQPFTRRGRYLGTCNPNHQFPSIQRVRRNRTGGTAHVIV
uniref:Uncharacterized protein n=1 Tax=Oryza glumipatula TaxID=40148 RepID=A0A0D9YQH5_9ORYZ